MRLALALAFGIGVTLTATDDAHAQAAAFTTNARIVNVAVNKQAGTPYGDALELVIKFSGNVGSGCTTNNTAVFMVFPTADGAVRDVALETLNALRQQAVTALLSGKLVDVATFSGCGGSGGFRLLQGVHLK